MLTGDRPGDNATYTCDAGFVLVGDAMLTCQDDGMWSDIPPTCQGITSDTGNFCGICIIIHLRLYLMYCIAGNFRGVIFSWFSW